MKGAMRMRKNKIAAVGIEIKKRLADLNWTQRELAERVGIDETYLHQIMYGYRSGQRTLDKIGNVLGVKLKKIA